MYEIGQLIESAASYGNEPLDVPTPAVRILKPMLEVQLPLHPALCSTVLSLLINWRKD